MRWKLALPIGDVEAARERLEVWRKRCHEAVEGVDVLVAPLLDGAAPTLEAVKAEYERDEFIVGGRLLRHTPQYNELGWPALAVPTADGLVQVAGRPGSERPRCLPSAGNWGCRARTPRSLADPRVSGPRVLLLQ